MAEIYLGALIRDDGRLQFDLFYGSAHYRRADRALDGRKWENGRWQRMPASYDGPFSSPHSYARYHAIKRLPDLKAVRETIEWKRNDLWGMVYYRAQDVAAAKARAAAERG